MKHIFQFLGGYLATALFMPSHVECPLCYEEVSEVVISKCGHPVCMDCLIHLYKINTKQGTLVNLLRYEEFYHPHQCFMCRCNRPFDQFLIWNTK
jgi:hypothetical protein